MLVGYVSDETYLAIADALVEFESGGESAAIVRSSPRGAIYADIAPGKYKVTLSKSGFGSKHVQAAIDENSPVQFRLLSDSLLGYAWPKWIKSGKTSEFRVHSVEAYRLSLWRYGKEKEFVRQIGWFDEHSPRAVMQITPDGDYVSDGVKWNSTGYPKNAPAQQVLAPGKSGLYYFHAETESGKFFSFPWVVAPASPASPIAVLASTNTWNAYNNFGGRSNYINTIGLPDTPTVNSRQDLSRYTGEITNVWQFSNELYPPLSFDRPEPFNSIPLNTQMADPIRGRQSCHLAEAEWRLLGWLEKEGFDYDLYSDAQLHSGDLDLDAYDVLIVSTHPEYWSRDQYFRVKEWVYQRGGKLMYLGGNGIDCEVEFLDDSRLHIKNEVQAPSVGNPYIHPETGALIECRFQNTTGESPAALLGVVFTEPGIATGAPYQVTDASSWIYDGTGLRNGDLFGTNSLHERCPGGASGHETDKRSGSTPENMKFAARGLNADEGGAEVGYYETDSGGAVFSVGSISWGASLPVDKAVSQITKNVLSRFKKRHHKA
jgi:hypothetical protein